MSRSVIRLALASAGFAALVVAIPSCASILGIEDLAPGNGGAGGSSTGGAGGSSKGGTAGSSAGGSNGTAGSSAGGSGGDATGGSAGASGGSGGSTGGSGGSSGTGGSATGGSGGNPVDGGGGRGGTGGSSSGDSGAPITVHGTVIDYWRHRVPNAAVYIGAATTMTDGMGQFTFNNVTPPYDIGLAVRVGLIQYGGSEDTYLFKGLKRSDPTLQVKDGLVGNSSTGNTWKFQSFPSGTGPDGGTTPRFIGIAFGSPDTIWDYTFQDPDGTDLGASYIDYEGGASSAGRARALLWETPTLDQVSPTRYVAYDDQPLAIDEVTTKNVTFNMSDRQHAG